MSLVRLKVWALAQGNPESFHGGARGSEPGVLDRVINLQVGSEVTEISSSGKIAVYEGKFCGTQ